MKEQAQRDKAAITKDLAEQKKAATIKQKLTAITEKTNKEKERER